MANPQMEMGGLYNCSKYKQLQYIPREFKPITVYVQKNTPLSLTKARLEDSNLIFPLIAKPDRGERGEGVSLIKDDESLKKYLQESKSDFLIQEFIDTPFEAGVFYYRMPGQTSGFIPSIVVKSFLKVIGDGYTTVKDLIFQLPRARIIANRLLAKTDINPNEILPLGSVKVLEIIGNHNRGTKFIDGNHLHNQELICFFDSLSNLIPHFHYGRFDLRAPSEEDFKKGRGIKILEVNGVNAEPAHIYDPNTKFWVGASTLLRHWKIISKISVANKKEGFRPTSFCTAWKHYREWKN